MNKLIRAAKEAVAVASRDFDAVSKIKVTPSCGCVFCDLQLEANPDGFHYDPHDRHEPIPCKRKT